MPILSFSDFAKALRRFMPGLNQQDFVKTLLDNIVVFENEDLNPVHTQSLDTLKKYYSGGPFQAFAKRIQDNLDQDRFSEFVADIDLNIQEEVRKELADYLDQTLLHNFPEACADLFARVIRAEAKGEDVVGSNEQITLPMAYGLQTVEDRLKDECERRCLLCGGKLKSFVKTEIVPSESDQALRNEIRSILKNKDVDDVIPDLANDYDTHAEYNLALLDPNCHAEYKSNLTSDKCIDLLLKKNAAIRQLRLQEELDSLEVSESLGELLDSLNSLIEPGALDRLEYRPKKINSKIEESNHILRAEVNGLVARYFGLIRQELHARDGVDGFHFIDLQYNVRKCYGAFRETGASQDEIFGRMAVWVMESTGCKNLLACEILIAFFVQNCEVFDEIA